MLVLPPFLACLLPPTASGSGRMTAAAVVARYSSARGVILANAARFLDACGVTQESHLVMML